MAKLSSFKGAGSSEAHKTGKSSNANTNPYQTTPDHGPELPKDASKKSSNPYQASSDYGPALPVAPSKAAPFTNSTLPTTVPAVRKVSGCSTASTVSAVSMEDSAEASREVNTSVPTDIKADVSSAAIPSGSTFYLLDHYGLALPPKKSGIKTDALKLELEKCYARAICYAIGSGGTFTDQQASFIKGLLAAKGYEVVDSIDAILKASAKMVDLELVTEVGEIVSAGNLKSVAPVMLYDMYRAAAVADFPGTSCVLA